MGHNVVILGKSTLDRKKPIEIAVDEHSRALVTIEMEHARIHSGRAFQISGKMTIASAATAYLLGKNTDGTPIHWRAASIAADDGPMDLYLYEAPTTTDDGTPLTVLNKNRLSSNTSIMTVFSGPTVTDVGTELEVGYIPPSGATGSHSGGGETERVGGEWILAPNTNYLISITNNDTISLDLGYTFFWYELAE